MNRRTAIKQFFILAGGMYILSSCESGGASIELNKLKISKDDESFLADLADLLIPKSDSPGGKDLNLHLFVIKMVDDCESPENQEKFVKGFNALRKSLKITDKNAAIEQLKHLKAETDEQAFFQIFKNRALQGYLNSEYIMKNKLIYELVPSKNDGALKIKA